jgi:hypothetical protein
MAHRGAGLLIASRASEGWQVLLGYRMVYPFFGTWVVLGGQRPKADKDGRLTALRTAGFVLAGGRPAHEALRDHLPPGFDAAVMPEHEYVSGGGSRWHTYLMTLDAPVDPATLLVAYPYSGAAWFPVADLPTPTHEVVVRALAHFGLAGAALAAVS